MNTSAKIIAKKPAATRENSNSPARKIDLSQSNNSPVDQILYLQRTIGNQAVQKLFKSSVIQSKLKIGKPGDIYEQEADRVAEQVMCMPEPQVQLQPEEEELIQTKPISDQITPLVQRQVEEEEELIQTEFISAKQTSLQRQVEEEEKKKEEEKEMLQPKEHKGQSPEISPNLESCIHSIRGSSQPLPKSTRAFFEPRFCYDFSQVRVHSDSRAAEAARLVNAKAFTTGKDVVFGTGQYSTKTSTGKRLLAHELTHVVQHSKGSPAHIQRRVLERRVSCHDYPPTHRVIRAIGTNDPVGDLRHADSWAIEMLDNVISTLKDIRARVIEGELPIRGDQPTDGKPLISVEIEVAMRDRLGLDAYDPAIWTRKGPGTAEIIIRWYSNIRKKLDSGWIRYVCHGAACRRQPRVGAYKWRAHTSTIFLCPGFWQAGIDAQAGALIHETAHLYYGLHRHIGTYANPYNLEGFVLDLNARYHETYLTPWGP